MKKSKKVKMLIIMIVVISSHLGVIKEEVHWGPLGVLVMFCFLTQWGHMSVWVVHFFLMNLSGFAIFLITKNNSNLLSSPHFLILPLVRSIYSAS